MADYTIRLKDLFLPNRFGNQYYTREQVEGWFSDYNLSDYLTPEQISVIENAGMWSKEKLAKKIVDHYYMREIGFETPALFEHQVKIKMQEIMELEIELGLDHEKILEKFGVKTNKDLTDEQLDKMLDVLKKMKEGK